MTTHVANENASLTAENITLIEPLFNPTIATAAEAVSDAVIARDPRAMVRLHLELVRDLAAGCGTEWGEQPCAASVIVIGRMVVPVLDADMSAESSDPRSLEPIEAAAITECLGLNVLLLLSSSNRWQN
jgi:hypothetical protein